MTKIVHTDAFTQRDANTQGCFYTRVLLFSQRHAFTHRRLHIQKLLRGDDFTRNYPLCLYTALLLHRGVFTHMRLYAGSLLTQSILYTDKLLHKYFYAEMYLHTNTCIQRRFLHTDIPKIPQDIFTKRCFARILLHRDAFTHRRFWTRTLLGRGTFAWVRLDTRFTGGFKPFWTQAAIQSHLYVYTQIRLLQGDASAHKCSYTGRGLRTEMV